MGDDTKPEILAVELKNLKAQVEKGFEQLERKIDNRFDSRDSRLSALDGHIEALQQDLAFMKGQQQRQASSNGNGGTKAYGIFLEVIRTLGTVILALLGAKAASLI